MDSIIMEKKNKQEIIKFITRVNILLTACLISLPLKGQLSFQSDTLKIQELIITTKQITSEQPGFKFYSIDSVQLKAYSLSSLTEVLNATTPLFIKYYGSGGSATSSFRGTSAGHTQITWNGININDPMLGQSDFSLIPSGMIDNVMISFGGASMDLGTGAIGGIINLENEPSWKKQALFDVTLGAGSFGRYTGLVRVNTGSDYFQSVTKAYLNASRNDFPYFDIKALPEPLWEHRTNNQMFQKSFMQELYLGKSENLLSARFWYQSATRDLPGSTLYGYSGEKQSDESLRSLINYNFVMRKQEYFTTIAWLSTKLNYTSELYSIDSRNKANTLVFKGGITTPLGQFARLKIVLSDEFNIIESNNYNESIKHNNASVTLSAERKKGKRFGAVILLRETLDDNSLMVPDFSAGFEFRLISGEDHYLKWNVARNSKIPSLNDCYWNPGGNPDLKNEYAYSFELGYKMDQKISSSLNIGTEVSLFSNYIKDMIQWQQGESSYWIPDNISSANTSGLESSISFRYSVSRFLLNFNAGYSYVRAVSKESETPGRQLIYIPKNQGNGSLQIGYKKLYSIWLTDFTGRTFITADNVDYLPGYTVNKVIGGIKIDLRKCVLDLNFKIENLFNVNYQTIEFYPQPGRSFFMTLSFQLRKQ
ncbi:MAG: TonB-dependent receptor [Bacteroidales bacterium]|nr:TonB-dependent receptor [Bacteroidales bacterium]